MAVLQDFANRISDEMSACRRTGRVTDRALDFLQRYSTEGKNALYKELFEGEDA
jgi:hypothetical protein